MKNTLHKDDGFWVYRRKGSREFNYTVEIRKGIRIMEVYRGGKKYSQPAVLNKFCESFEYYRLTRLLAKLYNIVYME